MINTVTCLLAIKPEGPLIKGVYWKAEVYQARAGPRIKDPRLNTLAAYLHYKVPFTPQGHLGASNNPHFEDLVCPTEKVYVPDGINHTLFTPTFPIFI